MARKAIGVYRAAQVIMDTVHSFNPETGQTLHSREIVPCKALPFAAYDKEGVTWRVSAEEAEAIQAGDR